MNDSQTVYCRLCVQPKTAKNINMKSNSKKFRDIIKKLSLLSYNIDFTDNSQLPKTVCIDCYMSLTKAANFIKAVEKSQRILNKIFTNLTDNTQNEQEIKSEIDNGDHEQNITMSDEIKQLFSDTSAFDVKIETKVHTNNVADLECSLSDTDYKTLETMVKDDFKDESAYFSENIPEDRSWSGYTWVCQHCNEELDSMHELRMHSKDLHRKCFAFLCIDCTTEHEKFDVFVDHVRLHRVYLRNYCPYCNEYIRKSRKLHLATHFKPPQTACETCGEIFQSNEAYNTHRTQYNNIIEKVKRKLQRVYGRKVTVNDLTCDICQKVYKTRKAKYDHQKIHEEGRKRDYNCEKCGKAFYTKANLQSHIITHDNVKPYVCKICSKSFISLSKLRDHVNIHTATKPFTCEECGRSFRLKDQMKSHKIIHTDQMPYKCKDCGKLFRFKQILKNHLRQHTGIKPYSCEVCSMVFTNWSNYNKHMVRKHKLDMSKKKITPQGVFPVNPETGQVVQMVECNDTEEWKSKIMIHLKRGKKPKGGG